ncbi:MAG: hypothetical protein CBARDMAM_2849 [uncultured Caballeronia sp.]|nr:MAG: hypothetical protein CBARDMAM_2849 [uncultured Caballeronia sp.]
MCVAAAALFAECTVGPDYRRPPAALPAQWTSPASDAQQTVASCPVAEPVDTRVATVWRPRADVVDRARGCAANLDVEEAGTRVAGARGA